jgi:hydrophobe/amphiphile efflux-3 (HAE3) family protein
MKLYSFIARIIREHPLTVVAVALLVTIALVPGLFLIKGEVTQRSMLPPDFPSNKSLRDLTRVFGGTSYEQALIVAPRVTNNTITHFLIGLEDFINNDPNLSKEIARLPSKQGKGVPEILRKPVPIIQDYLTPFIANVKQGIAQSGFNISLSEITESQIKSMTGKDFQQTVEQEYLSVPDVQKQMVGQQKFLTSDYKTTIVLMKQNPSLSDSQQVALANNLEKLFKAKLSGVKGLKLYFSGDATLARDFDHHIKNKTLLLFLLSILFVIVTLFMAFRRLTDTVVPIGVMLVSLIWTFGLMGYAGVPYSIAAVAIMPVLLGHALTFVVPFIARYYEEEEQVHGAEVATSRTLLSVGIALFPAAATSIVGFLVFLFSVLPPLKNFGLTAALGTFALFVLSITLLPAIIVIRDMRIETAASAGEREKYQTHFDGFRRRQKRGLYARGTDRVLHWSFNFSTRYSWLIVIGGTALILLGFAGRAGLKTDSDLRALIPRDLESIAADLQIEKAFGPDQTDFIMVRGDVLQPKSLQAMLKAEDEIAKDPRGRYSQYDPMQRTHVSGDYYPREGMDSLADVVLSANNGVMPADRQGVLAALDTAAANGGYVGGVLSDDHRYALISMNGRAALSNEAIKTKMSILNRNSDKHLVSQRLGFEVGGITPLINDMTRNIIPTETWSSVLSLLVCGLILIIIFRSVPYGLITLTVAFAGASAEVGFLWLMNWPLDVITSLVSALVIAIGSNFGILFTHRYIQAVRSGDVPHVDALRDTILNLGRANVVAAISTCAGFLIIMLSQIEPLKRFGGVTAFGIFWCLVASLTLVPALLHLWSQHQARAAEKRLPAPEPAST